LISEGTLKANLSRNVLNPTSGALGNAQTVGRTLTISAGATLDFASGDVMGSGASSPNLTIIANGGTITNSGAFFNVLGPVQLNGATITSIGGGYTDGTFAYPSFALTGLVTVGGSSVSTISTSGTNSGIGLKVGGTTFDVADAVSGSGSDLNVTGILKNYQTIASNPGALIKTGIGTMMLSGTNTYTGATTVSSGTLTIASTGTINTTSGVLVGAGNFNYNSSTALSQAVSFTGTGGTLSGNGTISQSINVTSGNILAIGNSVGQMNFGNALILAGGHDFANVTGALTYGGTMTLDMGVLFGAGTYSWNLFDMASETGTFSAITLADQYSGSLLDGDSNGVWDLTNGNDTWSFTESTGVLGLTVIPEPKTALLCGLGLLMLLRRRR
jgi:autotransporter-associated beta strand protein